MICFYAANFKAGTPYENDVNQASILMVIAITIIIAIPVLTGIIMAGAKAADKKANPEKYKAIAEMESRPRIKLTYTSGHPALHKQEDMYLFMNNNCIEMYRLPTIMGYKELPPVIASIPVAAIKNIVVENQSTTDYETTPRRFLMMGTLALALKNKVVNEAAVLTISWKDSGISYETCFKKKGIAAVAEMTNAKATLIHWINDHE